MRSIAAALLLLLVSFAAQAADEAFKLAIAQAVAASPSFSDRAAGRRWLAEMSKRLEAAVPDPYYRIELLKTVHQEATRAGLAPELVLSVIQVESNFDRFAVSKHGAQGLMQVMPFWKKEIGHPRDNLFRPKTNLRYGCFILKHYLDLEGGNLVEALTRYNGGSAPTYPARVSSALLTHWQMN
jgi:soluble lytic murein transglycosylase-like protein